MLSRGHAGEYQSRFVTAERIRINKTSEIKKRWGERE
jgi:hypothetical protein